MTSQKLTRYECKQEHASYIPTELYNKENMKLKCPVCNKIMTEVKKKEVK